MIQTIRNFFKRNYAASDIWEVKMGQPIYTSWTIQKAVKEGYKKNPVVYRAVQLIVKAAASVPWMVVNEEGEETESYLTDLITHPNPWLSSQDMFELLYAWIELSGNAYLKTVKAGGKTSELWPVSPDRIGVIPSPNITEWIKGYSLDNSRKIDFLPDEIIHFMFFNPASPYIGIAPLEAVAKVVDTDSDQQDFNKSAMQNRCVLDGIMSFDREFMSQDQADAMSDRINERSSSGPSNARKVKVVGSNAKYTRIASTPVEMDFSESRKQNRDLIYQTFGIPPQYAGSQEASTYNNYQTSELVFWVQTIIPLLSDFADALNFNLKDELRPGEQLSYDISQVPAMREALFDKTKTGKTLFDMGVPFSEINRVFGFGIDEFEGWDESKPSQAQGVSDTQRSVKKKTSPYLLKREMPLKMQNVKSA